MICYELQKLFTQKLTVAILVVLLALNGILIYHSANEPLSKTSPITRVHISEVYEYYEGKSSKEIATDIQNWLDDYRALWYVDNGGNYHQPTQEQLDEITVFTDRARIDAGIRSQVLSQVQSLSEYKVYLDSVQNTAESLSKSSLYSNENSFYFRNLIKTAATYLPLYDVEVIPSDSSGVKIALEGHVTTILLLFAMVMLVMNLTLSERDEGLLILLKPTVNGRLCMIIAKIMALLFSLLVLTMAFWGTNIVIGEYLFGLGDLRRSIQSLDGYITSPWMISVGQYIIIYFLAKYLSVATVGLVFFLICIILKKRIPACVVGIGILTIELLLYIKIPYHSMLSILRQVNLAALLDTTEFFSDYLNLNFFSFPISAAFSSLITCILVSVVGSVIACFCWCREESLEIIRRKKQRSGCLGISTSLFRHESYKLLVTCKGGMLLVLLLVVQLISYSNLNAYEAESEIWYQYYAKILGGNYNEENAVFIEEEQAFFDSISVRQQEYTAMAERGEISHGYASFLVSQISPDYSKEEGFLRAKEQYEYLKTQHEEGKTVQFISTTEYNYLLDDTNSDVLDTAKLCFILAVCFSMYFTIEDSSGMMQLIQPSPIGKNAVTRTKLIACSAYLLLVCSISFLPRIMASMAIYPLPHLNFAAASLPQFQNLSDGLSIGGCLVILNFTRLVVAIIITLCILLVAQKVKQPIPVLIICLVFLELPVFLNLLGVADEFAFLPLLTGHWIFA